MTSLTKARSKQRWVYLYQLLVVLHAILAGIYIEQENFVYAVIVLFVVLVASLVAIQDAVRAGKLFPTGRNDNA